MNNIDNDDTNRLIFYACSDILPCKGKSDRRSRYDINGGEPCIGSEYGAITWNH